MRNYIVSDWFWFVGSDRSRVWASADAAYLLVQNPRFEAFLREGNSPSTIGSVGELEKIFEQQFPAGMLPTYANAKQWERATAGFTALVGGVEVIIPTSVDSMSLMGGKVQRLSMPNPPDNITWQIGATTFVDIPAADFITIAAEIADHVQSTFDILKIVFADIQSGAITTIQQIDQRFES